MRKGLNNENAYAILEAGETYQFADYRWVPVEINENCHVAVMQSLGVTAGPWPGFSMENLGDGKHYAHNIDEYDISRYDDKTYALMKQIKPVSFIDGLYLPGFEDINDNQLWKDALARAASRYSSFGASYSYAWTGTHNNYCNGAWVVNSNGNTYNDYQNNSYVVPVAFNLDLSKVEVVGDEIIKKAQPAYIDNLNKIKKEIVTSMKIMDVTIKGIKESDEYKMAQAYNQGLRDAMSVFERESDHIDQSENPSNN